MADINAIFYLPSDGQSGPMTGGFEGGNQLSTPGSLNVTVLILQATNYPSTLTGTFVLTAAPLADTNQTAPSPFQLGSGPTARFQCITSMTASAVPSGQNVTYTFSGIPYPGGQRGSYELTFIAANGDTQWSIDPEFDTSN